MRVRSLGSLILIVTFFAGCAPFKSTSDPDGTSDAAAVEALIKALAFDGGELLVGLMPDATTDEVWLSPFDTGAAEPGASLMSFGVTPTDAPVEAAYVQLGKAPRHFKVGKRAFKESADTGKGSRRIALAYTVDGGVCDNLCDRSYALDVRQAVHLSGGDVSKHAMTRITLDCRGRGDRDRCTKGDLEVIADQGVEPMDAAMPEDSAVPVDSAVAMDSATPMDAAVPMDSAVPVDSAVAMDSATPMDSAVAVDSAVPIDSAVATDAGGPLDSAVPPTDCGCAPMTITVGTQPSGVAMSPNGARVYVSNAGSNTISVIDTSTDAVIDTFNTLTDPGSLAVRSDGARLYVGYGYPSHPYVTVFDTSDGSVVTDVDTSTSWGTVPLAISPDGAFVYAGLYPAGPLTKIDTATNTVVAAPALPIQPYAYQAVMAVTPNGSEVWLGSISSTAADQQVDVFGVGPGTFGTPIDVAGGVSGLAFLPDGSRAYLVNNTTADVSVVATSDHSLVTTVPRSFVGGAIAVTPNGARAYVLNGVDDSYSVIDTNTNVVVKTAPVGGNPCALAISPDGSKVYVANNDDGTVSVILTAYDP